MKNKSMLLYLCCFMTFCATAQENFETKTVAIFKNNAAFFMKEAIIKPKDKQHFIDLAKMPRASFGTFWLSSKDLLHLSSYPKEFLTYRTLTIDNLPKHNYDLLKKNVGRNATIYISSEESFKGKIQGVSDKLAILEQENGEWLNLPVDIVKWVLLDGKPNGFEPTTKQDTIKTMKDVVTLAFTNNESQNVELIYFQNGLGWTPIYKIELLSENKAKMTLQAAVVNNAEDLKNTNINFVVGFPNIKYFNTLDILFNSANFAQILNSGNNNMVQFDDRARRGSSVAYEEFSLEDVGIAEEANPSIKGEAEEDLYFYSLKNISLPKGGKGYYSIFETEIPYQHLYEVRLNNNHNGYYTYKATDFNDAFRNKVWHTIKLENKSENAWTSGPAMVVKRDKNVLRPISQDDLNYTSISGKTALQLTVSPDVSVKDTEKEMDRVVYQKQVDNYYYDIVKVKGEIKLQNYKAEEIRLNVKKEIVGNLKTSTPTWLTATRVNTNTSYNKTNDVCWELTLKAGEKMVVEYEYEVYVRR